MNAVFSNPFQAAMSEYKAQFLSDKKSSKPVHKAPEITGEVDEDTWQLANGNTILKSKYDEMWNPAKTPIKPFGYKGDNQDKTHVE